jgi:hypothetical protein
VVSLFCRHNRFTADCPICSRGTVLEQPRRGRGEPAPRGVGERDGRAPPARRGGADTAPDDRARAPGSFRGRYGSVGPYEREGSSYDIRLERVPGGLRLAEWSAGRLAARAPVVSARDLPELIEAAAAVGALSEDERDEMRAALAAAVGVEDSVAVTPRAEADDGSSPEARDHGTSPGRSGELREQLRVERREGEEVRIARWVLRPGTGWDLLDAPPMLPARRFAEALRDAATRGLLG